MSTKIIYRTNKTNKEGKHPLYIRIIKNRRTQFISLGIYLLPEEWDENKNRVRTKHPNSGRLNSYISQKVAEAEEVSIAMTSKDVNTTALKIKETIKGKALGSFSQFFQQHIDSLLKNDKAGTYIKAKASLSKLNQFTNNRNIQFEDIDIDFLKKYELFLSEKLNNSVNTIHSSIKVIRKLFNDAVRDAIIEPQNNPFLRFKLKTERTKKDYLTEQEISAIEQLDLTSNSKMDQHRDIFLFACDAGGIRVSDLLKLKWKNFDGTHISIVTQKTNEHISIKVPNKAILILKKYKLDKSKTNDYIFPLLKADDGITALALNQAISSATAYINKDLKKIAQMASIEINLSMHVSRHTWATRALRKGVRIEYVSKLLGHANIKTTQVYAKIVNSELDKAMEVFND